jgi:DNA-binding PucR family transcriptional regulator
LTSLPPGRDYVLALTKLIEPDAIITGVSYPFGNVMLVARYYRQACAALYYGRYLRRASPVYAASIALEEISQLAKNNEEISVFIHSDVQKLTAYDKRNNSDLSRSLFYYLYFGCNSTDAANYLGIHRNTLKYRLAKIQELLSLNIDDTKERLLLLISYIMFGFPIQGG